MTTFLRLLPVILSLVVLAAHFLRSGHLWVVAGLLALLPLLALRRAWVARLVQAVLVLGAAEWVRTTLALVDLRRNLGAPYLRMVLILAAVAAVTAASALVFETRPLRRFYRGDVNRVSEADDTAGPG